MIRILLRNVKNMILFVVLLAVEIALNLDVIFYTNRSDRRNEVNLLERL